MKIERKDNIEVLDLSVRSWKACLKNGITTVGDLIDLNNDFIEKNIANHSKIVYHEITDTIQKYKNKVN